MERLPGQERPRHEKALAVGVLRFLVLLVGLRTPAHRRVGRDAEPYYPIRIGGKGEKEGQGNLAGGLEGGKGMVGAMDNARGIQKGVLRYAPPRELRVLLEKVFSGRGLYPYVR
jgi:hypothetical protein